MRQDREHWSQVVEYLEAGIMPPEDQPQPATEEIAEVNAWVVGQLARLGTSGRRDPGRVTIRRLNRAEYDNTVRDLVGVEFKPAADFPSDDVGYGFDNIGDVLSLPPILLEKYLAAAEKIASEVIVTHWPPEHTTRRFGVAKEAGTFSWVVGAYSFNEKQSYDPTIAAGFVNVVEREPSIPDNSQAGFGQATYAVLDRLRVTAGVRYTHDYEAQTGTFTENIAGNSLEFPISGSVSYDNVSWKGAIEGDITDKVLGYVSVTTGYHAGGLTDSIPAIAPQGNTYRPEHVKDYEAGMKGRWFDNRVQFNTDVFYYDYRDLQVGVTAPPFFPTTYNANKARLEGWETEGSWLITQYDLVGFSTIYEDSKYLDYCVPSAYYLGNGAITTCPSGELGYNYASQPFANVPKWAGTLNYQHTFPLPNGDRLIPAFNSRFKSRYTAGNVTEVLPSYTNSSATVTYGSHTDHWNVMLFVRNIENKPDYTSTGTLLDPTLDYRTPAPPRTYGVRFTATW